jgi:hypothetical protein
MVLSIMLPPLLSAAPPDVAATVRNFSWSNPITHAGAQTFVGDDPPSCTGGDCCKTCPPTHPYCAIGCPYPDSCITPGHMDVPSCVDCVCTCRGEPCCYNYHSIPCPKAPGPHICEKGWPVFATEAELSASPWGSYFADVYGSLPAPMLYPIDTSKWWMLYDSLIAKHALPLPASAGTCAPPDCELNRFSKDNAYSPPSQWIWHPPPYAAFADNTWVEVVSCARSFFFYWEELLS